MHHSDNKEESFINFEKLLLPGGYVAMLDVFSGTKLALHFDKYVARYCITGHEVSFWSEAFAKSIANKAGFAQIEIIDLPLRWWFDKREGIGDFMYYIHAMLGTTREICSNGVEEALGIGKENGKWFMNWPINLIILKKA